MNWTEATSTRSVRGSWLPGSLPSQGSAVTPDPKPLAHQPTHGSTLCPQEVRKFSSDMRAAVTAVLPPESRTPRLAVLLLGGVGLEPHELWAAVESAVRISSPHRRPEASLTPTYPPPPSLPRTLRLHSPSVPLPGLRSSRSTVPPATRAHSQVGGGLGGRYPHPHKPGTALQMPPQGALRLAAPRLPR